MSKNTLTAGVSTGYESAFDRRTSLGLVVALWAHLPIMLSTAFFFKNSYQEAVLFTALIASGPTLLFLLKSRAFIQQIAIGIASGCMSGLLIHLGSGMIEMHFHVFVMIGVLILTASPWSILSHTFVVAVHHVGFYALLPESVFNYQATWGIVFLHAAFALAQTFPCMWIAHLFRRSIKTRGRLEGEARLLIGEASERINTVKGLILRVAQGSQQNTSAITESNAILNDISERSDSNAESASSSNLTSTTIDASIKEMSIDISRLNKSMEEIQRVSADVGTIVQSIEEIAFQTNLLALNAAVEAARAGEAGAGFSVVADEVRSLAQRSSSSVAETTSMIDRVRVSVQQSVEINARVIKGITELERCSSTSREQFKSVASSCEEQSKAILEIKAAIESIENVSSETANQSDVANRDIEDLAHRMRSMQKLLEELKK